MAIKSIAPSLSSLLLSPPATPSPSSLSPSSSTTVSFLTLPEANNAISKGSISVSWSLYPLASSSFVLTLFCFVLFFISSILSTMNVEFINRNSSKTFFCQNALWQFLDFLPASWTLDGCPLCSACQHLQVSSKLTKNHRFTNQTLGGFSTVWKVWAHSLELEESLISELTALFSYIVFSLNLL